MGLPLALEFAKKYPTVGYDISSKRINELKEGIDTTLEVSTEGLSSVLVPNLIALQKRSFAFYLSNQAWLVDTVLELIFIIWHKKHKKLIPSRNYIGQTPLK